MSAQPVQGRPVEHLRAPRTVGGIFDALQGSRRAQFFAELLEAQQGAELDGVLNAWWGRAMLDTDPDRHRIRAAAEAGTLPTRSMDDVLRRRQELGAR